MTRARRRVGRYKREQRVEFFQVKSCLMEGNVVAVLKADKITNIPEDELRNGDVLLLQAGDLVPADLKLLEASGLEVDEWELTGEIVPAAKQVGAEDVFIYRGSRVTRGRGKGLVVATREETEYAEILKQPWERAGRKPPILIKGRYLLLPLLLLPPCVVAWRQAGQPALVGSLVLLVAALVVLLQNGALFKQLLAAAAARRLERRNIRIHDITALDVIGDLDIACLDKTGVLTSREIAVKHVHFADATPDMAWFASADGVAALTGVACALCNDVVYLEKVDQANPIDQALIAFAAQNGHAIDEVARQYRRIYDQPFDSEARYMAAGFEQGDRKLYFAKGDPEVISRMCRGYLTAAGDRKETDFHFHRFFRTRVEAITEAGDIAIALTYSPDAPEAPAAHYAFLGLIELENPLRPGVPEAVAALQRAGVRTIMLTGDRPETATGVGRKARLDAHPEYLLTGKHLARMGFADIAWQSAYVSIFARLLPSQKGVLVRLFQQSHHTVAMVGDGANDVIALRAADVGISFVEHSSPLARRVSKVLINDVADLLVLIRSARRLRWWVRFLTLLRVAVLLALFMGLYAWMLNWL